MYYAFQNIIQKYDVCKNVLLPGTITNPNIGVQNLFDIRLNILGDLFVSGGAHVYRYDANLNLIQPYDVPEVILLLRLVSILIIKRFGSEIQVVEQY
jgi:hypothetical protein